MIELEISSDSIFELKDKIKNLGKISLKISNEIIENEFEPIEMNSIDEADSFANLETAKQAGVWRGDETSIYWCPSGLAFYPAKNEIIVADSLNNELKILDAENGCIKRKSSILSLKTPRDVCINSVNQLIISDSGYNMCCIVDYNNFNLEFEFGGLGSEKGRFNDQRGVCVDSEDRIFVCDKGNHRIQVFDSNGSYLTEWGSKGTSNGQFFLPEFICFTNGKLLVSDTGNHRIQIFSINSQDSESEIFGSFLGCFGSYGREPGCFKYPKGITTDSGGFIMVSDWKNNRLQLFEPDGEFVTEISNSSNNLNNQLNIERPVGISILLNGSLAISTWGRSQNVQII